jgi:cobalt/nickel transport system permease protein
VISALAHIGGGSPRKRRSRGSLARRTADAVRHAVSEVLENDEIASGPGLMQRLDPRIKLVSILLFAVTASFAQSILVLLAFVAATAGLAAASGIGVGSFSRKVWASAGFFGLILSLPAATAWISPGPVLIPLGPLSITSNGLLIAVRLTTRVAAGAGFGMLVVWTTRWTDILQALTAMRVPDIVVATLAMTQQQIMSLLRTVENIHLARESRMLSVGTATDNRAWVTERMAFIAKKSIKTADDVYDAMLSRGFSGAMPSLVRLHAATRDWVWLAASIAVCALFLGVDRVLIPR